MVQKKNTQPTWNPIKEFYISTSGSRERVKIPPKPHKVKELDDRYDLGSAAKLVWSLV